MSGVFIDWITLSQSDFSKNVEFLGPFSVLRDNENLPANSDFSLPYVDSGFVVKYGRDLATMKIDDEEEWYSHSRVHHEGSFSSGLMLRCDGSRVEFSGNVGRFDRPDNLFNYNFEETIRKANEFLALYGLPAFHAGDYAVNPNPSQYDIDNGLLDQWSGATVSMLHLTKNYNTGSAANAQAAIDWLATQSKSHVKRSRSGESTMSWGRKGGRVYLKAYIKAQEMLDHARTHGRTREEVINDPVYQYCLKNGVIRFELEAGRLLLRDSQLRFMGDITMQKLNDLFDEHVMPILGRVRDDITRIDFDTLDIASGPKMAALAYLRGEDVRTHLSRATFFRYAKVLREYGIDISEPLKGSETFTAVIKVIDIQAINEPPAWYWDHQTRMTQFAANDVKVLKLVNG
ncbi:hypothetical protein HA050_04130 [Iodobacter sp. HSC-16F04]|uniref:Replication-associated protein G2P N-terminal domain-containing protein n=1 Tax=Iodobacter violaceini TaxID=3044271 RepID=A0ABX0KP42_9NEIS|nr:phage/plasmid replication protein [Iodobacter violacea]NHQ85299.1 hypothetical protein [Iodobacter violacea]